MMIPAMTTVTADSDSSVATLFEEILCEWEADLKGIEATIHQIAAGSKVQQKDILP